MIQGLTKSGLLRRGWKIFALFSFLAVIIACSDNGRNELLCSAEYHYNTAGADAAIATVRQMGDEHDYAVANNVARFLILRGAKTGHVEDFDQAKAVLDAMELASINDPDLLLARYISVLRFLAIANGSDGKEARQELTQYCRGSDLPEAECMRQSMMGLFESYAINDGTKNKSYKEFAHLFNSTYRTEFDHPEFDVVLDYSRSVVTSCGTKE